MGQTTVEEQGVLTVQPELLTMDDIGENIEMINEGLKIVQPKLAGKDLAIIAMKVNRDVYTVRAYLRGEVRDAEVGLKILNYCNGFVAINNNAKYQKDKLIY